MIDNLRNFFINNMEQPDENDNEEEDEEMKELKEQKCKEHPYKNLDELQRVSLLRKFTHF